MGIYPMECPKLVKLQPYPNIAKMTPQQELTKEVQKIKTIQLDNCATKDSTKLLWII